jgi:EmrB/QacA subfamily drug resistance transporter
VSAESASGDRPNLRLRSAQGRAAIAVTALASGMVFLDGTVVNLALPAIGRDLDAGVASLQWTINGYLLTLAALIIIGGSLGDRFGRRRVFLIGTVWFTAASLICGLAPSSELLVAARVLQGIGGALLTPGSLAIIEAAFHPDDRAGAIGRWSGLAGVSTALGPVLGGYLIDALSWRSVFFLNVPIGVAVLILAARYIPETRGRADARSIDATGAALAAIGLAGVSFALIEGPELGAGSASVVAAAVAGVLALSAFIVVERRVVDPMLPLEIFRSRAFSAANIITFVVYAGLGSVFFFLGVFLQVALRYSPLEAGLAFVPVTVMLLLFSASAGRLAQRIGARPLLTAGSLIIAGSMLMMRGINPGDEYLSDLLPAVMVFSIGLIGIVAPVTATALSSAPEEHAGLASAVNNAVSRTGQLLAIALLPALAGLAGNDYRDPTAITEAFHTGMLTTAVLSLTGAVVAWTMLDREVLRRPSSATADAEG